MPGVEWYDLEIENPLIECGHCRFASRMRGEWSVEDGRLVFRADADMQPGRGPDLDGCYESDPVVRFKRVVVDGEPLTDEEVDQLRDEEQIHRYIGDIYDDPVKPVRDSDVMPG